MQWIVQDGVLEVDGAPMEEHETMRLKYHGLSEIAGGFLTEDKDTGATVLCDLDGFRLLRRQRLPQDAVHQGDVTWCTVEVRALALLAPALVPAASSVRVLQCRQVECAHRSQPRGRCSSHVRASGQAQIGVPAMSLQGDAHTDQNRAR